MKRKVKKFLAFLMAATIILGVAGCSLETPAEKNSVDKKDGKKKVAYISAANQFDFFVYIGAKIKKAGEENGVQVDMFDAALDVSIFRRCIIAKSISYKNSTNSALFQLIV